MRNRIASTFSFILLVSGFACATDYAALQNGLESAATRSEKQAAIHRVISAAGNDSQLGEAAQFAASSNLDPARIKRVEQMLEVRNQAQEALGSVPTSRQLANKASAIKKNPLYHDAGVNENANWLQRALEQLKFSPPTPKPDTTATTMPVSGVGNFFLYVVIGLLAAAIIAFIVVVVRHVDWKRAQKRKASAILEDDEPSRTADEWLDLADKLTAQGRYREAVRCLYLACLLRFDESQVARFDRRQTNWEHLSRIQASLRRPDHIDFLPPTRLFDRIWYGHRVRGVEDVEQFRAWYQEILAALHEVKAA